MSPLSTSRTISAALAIAVLFGLGAANAYRHGLPVLDLLTMRPATHSLRALGSGFRRARIRADSDFFGKLEMQSAHARLMTDIGKTEMNNFSVIKGSDGRLYRGWLFPPKWDAAENLGLHLARFMEIAEGRGTKVLYLAAPDAVPKGRTNLPENMPVANYNAANDALLYVLRERNVPFVDSRYEYVNDAFPPDQITARTGPLITGPALFRLFAYLVKGVNDRLEVNLDPGGHYRDFSRYNARTYRRFFLGRLGKETGPGFSGLDDFIALAPAFETRFRLEALDMFDNPVNREGVAERTILQPNVFARFMDVFNFYPESYYHHTNLSWSKTANLLKPEGPKILFVHDAYTAPLAALLAPACGELHTIAFRENQRHNAEEYIQDKNFDCVVVSFSPPDTLESGARTLLLREQLKNPE